MLVDLLILVLQFSTQMLNHILFHQDFSNVLKTEDFSNFLKTGLMTESEKLPIHGMGAESMIKPDKIGT